MVQPRRSFANKTGSPRQTGKEAQVPSERSRPLVCASSANLVKPRWGCRIRARNVTDHQNCLNRDKCQDDDQRKTDGGPKAPRLRCDSLRRF